jgi:glycosyltransferase involved in cell wall biosynthesis
MGLTVLPALRARKVTNGNVVLTEKFIDGMMKYMEYWDVPTTVIMEPSEVATTNLDEVEVNPAGLPFRLQVMSYDAPELGSALAGSRVVLSSLMHRQNHLSAVCRSVGVPCVYVAEYNLRTRCQIVRSEVRNPLRVARRLLREIDQERKHRRAVRLAAGIQCNGTPTYEDYRSINPRPYLFFDTRVREAMLIGADELETRLTVLNQGGPLRLLFSGRLIEIKGADLLIPVARELRRLGVPVELTICGGGVLEPRIRADIEHHGLGDRVKLAGVLDFKTELVALTKERADLFVCCHRSGDQSCTYMDVMGCGVPIVGTDNDAFRGIVQHSHSGWLVPMNRPERMAEEIARLNADRARLADASRKALEFARRHTFERTFQGRIEHLKVAASLGTRIGPGGSSRSPENPRIWARNRAWRRFLSICHGMAEPSV